jgi:hypothetical protein
LKKATTPLKSLPFLVPAHVPLWLPYPTPAALGLGGVGRAPFSLVVPVFPQKPNLTVSRPPSSPKNVGGVCPSFREQSGVAGTYASDPAPSPRHLLPLSQPSSPVGRRLLVSVLLPGAFLLLSHSFRSRKHTEAPGPSTASSPCRLEGGRQHPQVGRDALELLFARLLLHTASLEHDLCVVLGRCGGKAWASYTPGAWRVLGVGRGVAVRSGS